ncbi:MFS transporter [Pandoraea pnomenusa]|uniref:MFS transporter n=1 Tax=Pandoraea pnomenusa TaxID=93220 RepID=UPI001146951A|nr:MFS transporter [Pandoraea pnomenusa]QDH58477.1 multidrug efflux MFS transporter [Pandoraea pnomenusa]
MSEVARALPAWRGGYLSRFRDEFFPWAIALATGLDYFDNAGFAFFTSYIAGGINASPDELVWSSSAYAVASVLGILQQQWWVERLGYRRYVGGSLLLFAAGAVAAGLSESSIELALARGFQGYFIGPMMSACRILIRTRMTPQRRPVAVRVFLLMILIGSALAPLAGGYLIGRFGWRSLFVATGFGGVVLGLFAVLAVPSAGRVLHEHRGEAHFWPYLLFAFAQGALQIAMQQVRFELFGSSPELIFLTGAGLVALGGFIWQQWHHPRPLLRLHALREKTFQAGIMLYIAFYYLSNSMGFLVSRLLEGGLHYPVENAGRLVGLTSLVSVAGALIYFRVSARVTHKKWMIVPGFLMAALIAIWMMHMPPDVSTPWLIVPLVLRGLLLLMIALPVANVTFRIFALEEFHHGYRFKNIVKQLTYSFATATMIILQQHRVAVHETRLNESVSLFNPAFQEMFGKLSHGYESMGYSAQQAASLALSTIHTQVVQQASFLGSLDGFSVLVWVSLVGAVCAFVQKRID